MTVGDSVELELPSKPSFVNASVLEVDALANVPLSDTPPAVQIFVDQHGVDGDSGSLIADKTTSSGAALYRGKMDYSPYGGIIRGVGQCLGQVAKHLKIDLLKE